MRPYFDEGGIVIYHGDYREILPALGAFDAVVADLPYGENAYETDVPPELGPVMAAAPRVALFGYPELLCQWCIDIGRAPSEWITWWPSNAAAKAGGRSKGIPRQSECIAIFGDQLHADAVREPRSDNRPRPELRRLAATNREQSDTVRAGDVWTDASPGIGFNAKLRLHPNEKPLAVLHKLVLLCTAAGERLVDPACGSGTALRAAKDLGRRAIGIELVERHCETSARRLAQGVLIT